LEDGGSWFGKIGTSQHHQMHKRVFTSRLRHGNDCILQERDQWRMVVHKEEREVDP